ncbi:MAG TPA: 2-hydroxyglutaryl-CoA dehydratase [Cyanobacteria bacterium UBA8530]|nr:2-hydroxyglutaryl-CoA dehydratase [Cyanobacteria bacterium UBA8530]
MRSHYLGIDIGSVSTNLVLLDGDDPSIIRESIYLRNSGQPLSSVYDAFQTLLARGYRNEEILAVGTTGSARDFVGKIIGADVIKNEITAHAVAAISERPDVRTVIEIGGQDSKIIIIKDKIVVDFAMNTVCAAGTGSFLDHQSARLGIPIEEFGHYALKAESSVRIAGRCTVFAESDMIHKQQKGASKEELIAGLCEALARNYLSGIAKGKALKPPILFQGGVAHNIGIKKALEKELGMEMSIPVNFPVMGAIGAAMLAVNPERGKTRFAGLQRIENLQFQTVECSDCSNHCELTRAVDSSSNSLACWGDRCGKWQR